MNLIILLAAAGAAYLLVSLCNWIDYQVYRHNLKKFFRSDINRHKAKKIMKFAKSVFIENGYSNEEATAETIYYIDAITKNGQLDEKYKLLIGA